MLKGYLGEKKQTQKAYEQQDLAKREGFQDFCKVARFANYHNHLFPVKCALGF